MIREICQTLIPGYDPFANCGDCWFDAEAAQTACDFFPTMLVHVEGSLAGQPFVLEDWEKAIVGNLFGWKRKDARGRIVRRYRECLIYIPRKNGKTPLVAGISAYVFFFDEEYGQQDYVAASDREQASLLFRHLKGMVDQEPNLRGACRIYGGNAAAGQSRSLVRESDGSFLRVVSADADTKHGGNPHLTIMDELHAQPNAELYDVLHTGMASENRAQPLFISLTTADYERVSVCNERHNYACQVRDGTIDDQTFLPVVYETPVSADWTDPDVWRAANPNLGVSVSLDYLTTECKKAQEIPRLENTFKRLHLNMRTEADERWLSVVAWDDGDAEFDAAELLDQPCWCGLDLSTSIDLTAFAAVFHSDGKYRVLCHCWIPRDTVHAKSHKDRVSYETWINRGFITATDGARIDYAHVRRWIGDFARRHQVMEIAVDPWNATQIMQELDGDGFTTFEFQQGYRSMSPACKEFEACMAAREISGGKNPVLRWAIGNAMVEKDAAGNIKPSKAKSTQRIDPLVATVMAHWRASLAAGQSIYETRGVLSV